MIKLIVRALRVTYLPFHNAATGTIQNMTPMMLLFIIFLFVQQISTNSKISGFCSQEENLCVEQLNIYLT